MPAKIVELCDSLVSTLNGLTLSVPYTAVRYNVWTPMLEDTNAIRVAVIPQETEVTSETRAAVQRRFRVAVLVEKRIVDTTARDEQDELIQLCEELEDALYGDTMGQFSFDTYNETTSSRAFIDADAYVSAGVFRTGLQISYLGE